MTLNLLFKYDCYFYNNNSLILETLACSLICRFGFVLYREKWLSSDDIIGTDMTKNTETQKSLHETNPTPERGIESGGNDLTHEPKGWKITTLYIEYHRSNSLCKFFSVPCASLSMLGGPGRIDCGAVRFPVYRGRNVRDVTMAGVCECVKECEVL